MPDKYLFSEYMLFFFLHCSWFYMSKIGETIIKHLILGLITIKWELIRTSCKLIHLARSPGSVQIVVIQVYTSSVAKFIFAWSMLFIAVNNEHCMLDFYQHNLVKQNCLYHPRNVYNVPEMINNYTWDVCFVVFTPNVMIVMAGNKLSVTWV